MFLCRNGRLDSSALQRGWFPKVHKLNRPCSSYVHESIVLCLAEKEIGEGEELLPYILERKISYLADPGGLTECYDYLGMLGQIIRDRMLSQYILDILIFQCRRPLQTDCSVAFRHSEIEGLIVGRGREFQLGEEAHSARGCEREVPYARRPLRNARSRRLLQNQSANGTSIRPLIPVTIQSWSDHEAFPNYVHTYMYLGG